MTEALSNLPPQSYFDERDALALLVPRAKVLAALADAYGDLGSAVPVAQIEEPASREHDLARMEAERNASLDRYRLVTEVSRTEAKAYEDGFSAGWSRRGAGAAPAAVTPQITEPYTLAEIKAKIATHDYNAELLLQHAMLLLESAAVAPQGEYPPLPDPDSYLFQHEETGLTQCVDAQQVDWGFEKNNPRWNKCEGVFRESQMHAYFDLGRQPATAAPALEAPAALVVALPAMPPTEDRRPYDDAEPEGYGESDNEWIGRNLEAVRWFIDNHAAIRAALAAAPLAQASAPDWWRKRADEIEVQVAATGSSEAMRCYTDMRTLLQSAAAPQAPAAPVGMPAQGDPAALLQLAAVLESGRSLIDIERKEAAHALRLQAAAAPAAPAVDAPKDLDPGLSREVYRACEDLPEGWAIRIDLENGYGGVKLIDPDGEENELPVDGLLSDAMRESIAAAIAAQAKEGGA